MALDFNLCMHMTVSTKISHPNEIEDSLRKKTLKAIETCPVKRNLGAEIKIIVELV